jgi:IS605 OrfB family transposase
MKRLEPLNLFAIRLCATGWITGARASTTSISCANLLPLSFHLPRNSTLRLVKLQRNGLGVQSLVSTRTVRKAFAPLDSLNSRSFPVQVIKNPLITVKGSANRLKARNRLSRHELKVSRQRIERAKRLALCVVKSNDFVAYEDLRIRNMVKNHCLAKAIHDAGWYQFRLWLESFGKKYGKATVAVNPAHTSQECSDCGAMVKKSLSTRTHVCECGCVVDRDENAAINIGSIAVSGRLQNSS